MGEIEAADGATCDLFWKDMVAADGTENYNMSNDDFRATFMGKLEFMEQGKTSCFGLTQGTNPGFIGKNVV